MRKIAIAFVLIMLSSLAEAAPDYQKLTKAGYGHFVIRSQDSMPSCYAALMANGDMVLSARKDGKPDGVRQVAVVQGGRIRHAFNDGRKAWYANDVEPVGGPDDFVGQQCAEKLPKELWQPYLDVVTRLSLYLEAEESVLEAP